MFYKLDLGCSSNKPDGYIGVDIGYFNYPKGEFVQADINYPLPFEDSSFIEVRAMYVLEHIDNNKKVQFMNEVYRVLKIGGKFTASFPPPMTSKGLPNGMFYADPTHYACWIPGTFSCFSKTFRDASGSCDTYEKGYGITTRFEPICSEWVDDGEFHIELIKM